VTERIANSHSSTRVAVVIVTMTAFSITG